MSNGNGNHVDSLAEVYAKSLFELAMETGGMATVEQCQGELNQIVAISESEPTFGEFLRSRIISVQNKNDTIRQIFREGVVSDLMLRFLCVLNRKERLDHMAPIAEALKHLVWKETGRIEVEVFTASPMNEAQLETVRQRIASAIGQDPVISNSIDPSLIGGLKLRLGDQMIDASIDSRLRQIRSTLNASGANTIRANLGSFIVND